MNRRAYLRTTGAIGTAGIAGFAGCLDGDEEELAGDEDGDGGGEQDEQLEIIHWWTAGGEEDALNALLDGFLEEHGYDEGVIDENPAPGGAGAAIDAEIRSRVIDEDPPSTFQIWPGESLRIYTEADALADIGDVWDDDMQGAYLDSVQELASPEGELVSVPINIHRLNNVFFNTAVVEDSDVDPNAIDSPEAFLDALEAVDAAGYTGFAHQTQAEWSTLQLWETVFVAQHGADAFQSFLNGEVEEHEAEIQESLELVVDYGQYFSPDASSIAWDEANAQVINGDAAFIHQGDWAAGQYGAAEDFEYGTDWDYAAFPGTDGIYSVVMDSFVMPEPNPSPDLTQEFLSYCGTVDAQERFNPIKGSIPPRTDVPEDEFGPFLQDQMADFEGSEQQPPTIAHGSGIEPEGKSQIEQAFAQFIENWDPEETTQRIVNELG